MKFFLDTANLEEIRNGSRWGLVDGITTNPSLAGKEGMDYRDLIRDHDNTSDIHAQGAEFVAHIGRVRVHDFSR